MRQAGWLALVLLVSAPGCGDAEPDSNLPPQTIVNLSSGESFVGTTSLFRVKMREDGSVREATFELGSGEPRTNLSGWEVHAPLDVGDALDDGNVEVDLSLTPGVVVRVDPDGETSSTSGQMLLRFAAGQVEGSVVGTPEGLDATFESQFSIECVVDVFEHGSTVYDWDSELQTEQCAPLVALR